MITVFLSLEVFIFLCCRYVSWTSKYDPPFSVLLPRWKRNWSKFCCIVPSRGQKKLPTRLHCRRQKLTGTRDIWWQSHENGEHTASHLLTAFSHTASEQTNQPIRGENNPERTNRMLVTRGDNAELTPQPPGSLHCGFCRPQEPTHQRFWAGLFGARLWEIYRDHEHVAKQEWTLASSACLSNFQTSLNAFKKGTGAVIELSCCIVVMKGRK